MITARAFNPKRVKWNRAESATAVTAAKTTSTSR